MSLEAVMNHLQSEIVRCEIELIRYRKAFEALREPPKPEPEKPTIKITLDDKPRRGRKLTVKQFKIVSRLKVHGRQRSADLAKAAGYSKTGVYGALNQLKTMGQVKAIGRGWYQHVNGVAH